MRIMQPSFLLSVERVQQELGAGLVTLLDIHRESLVEFEDAKYGRASASGIARLGTGARQMMRSEG